MTGPVPAHGDQQYPAPAPTHVGMPGAPIPGAVPDYTGAPGPAMQPVPADQYDQQAEQARLAAEQRARELVAHTPPHPDDRTAAPTGEAAADMRAEVAHEQAVPEVVEPERSPTPEGAFEVTLTTKNGTDTIRVLDPNEWPSSANSALHVGEYESWAERCLADGDYEDVWMRLDPTLKDINAMFVEWRRVSGRDAGKSRPSPASLRRAARK
jgi:hypothetical protein